ncbi:hypothetical protein Tco_0112246, partial [Tanacetum coccineum]
NEEVVRIDRNFAVGDVSADKNVSNRLRYTVDWGFGGKGNAAQGTLETSICSRGV